MSALDSFLTVIAAPDVLWRSRNQGENYEHFVNRVQNEVNATKDPLTQMERQKQLDTFKAENDGKALSVSNGATGVFLTEYKNQISEATKFSFSLIPKEVWIIAGLGFVFFIWLRFSPK